MPIPKPVFPGTVFHNYHDAVRNIPPKEIDPSAFMPWGADEVAALSTWEATFLIMMDKFYPQWPVTKRYDFYYDLLRYWGRRAGPVCARLHHLQRAAAPDATTSYSMRSPSIAASRRYFLMSPSAWTALRCTRILRSGTKRWRRSGHRVLAGPAVSLEDLAPHVQEHFKQVSVSAKPSPHHFAYFKKEHSRVPELTRRAKALWPFLKDGSIYERAVARLFKMLTSNSKDEYTTYTKPVDFGKPYVYVPLNYQPECTTSPLRHICRSGADDTDAFCGIAGRLGIVRERASGAVACSPWRFYPAAVQRDFIPILRPFLMCGSFRSP